MRKALVLGASGGMGYALVREMADRGIDVVAFARRRERLESLFKNNPKVKIFPGDALNEADVKEAATGVDVIFNAVNFPYQEWGEKLPKLTDVLIKVAVEAKAKVVHVDNIYAYGQQEKQPVSESSQKNPHTKKGKIRLEMETSLKNCEAPALIVHMPDFYGPNGESTMLHVMLKNVVEQKNAYFVGNSNVAREYLYTFDGAKAMIELATREDTYNQNWNIPGQPITGNELMECIREITGYNRKFKIATRGMVRFLGIFSAFMREFGEMMYLTETPVLLKGKKYERVIGPLPRTTYLEGLKATIAWMKNKTNNR